MNSLLKLACVGVAGLGLFAGCAADRHAEIPSDAPMVAQGTQKLTYTAPQDGMVWVYNKFNGNMEWAGGVRAGDVVLVDPDKDKIFLNNHTVNDKPLTNDEKRIFFKPDTTVVRETRTAGYVEHRDVVDPATGRVVQQEVTSSPGTTVREYREVHP